LKALAGLISHRPDATEDDEAKRVGRGRELITTYATLTSKYSDRGILLSTEINRWLKSRNADADPYFRVENMYLTESGHSVVELHPLYGCRIEEQYLAAGGSIVTVFKLHKALKSEDEDYPIGYVRLVHGTRKTDPVTWWHALSSAPGAGFEARLNFHPSMKPLRAWWFIEESVSYGQREPDPAEGRHLELLDDGCYLFKSFRSVQDGYCHGIAWIWSDGDV
jgi:hypothetical protein